LGHVTTFGYDALGRRTTTVAPKGNVVGGTASDYTTTTSFNAYGDLLTLTDPHGRRTVRTYDNARNVLTVEDAEHRTTTYTYDDAGRLKSVTRPDLSTVSYEYDEVGNLTVQRDGATRTTSYTYDPLDRPVSMTDPLSRTTEFGYDGVGNRTSITDQGDQVTTMTFDAADHLRTISYSDPATPDVSFDYDELGRRLWMTDGTGTTTYTWDSLSRLTSSTDGSDATVGYGWDIGGHNTSITYPGGGTVTRGHDDAGRLTSVTDWLTNTTTFGYDANSNATTRTLPNGTTRTDAHDRANRLTSIAHGAAGTSFASFGLQLNDVAIPTAITPSGVPEPVQTYSYTARDQLQAVNGGTYSYDGSDNLTGLPSGAVLAYDIGNQLQSSTLAGQTTTFGFDGRGNRTSVTPPAAPATSLAYDQPNRLVAYGTGATYAYNGDGIRMSKTVDGVQRRFVWTGVGLPALLKDGTDFYVYGPNGTPIERIASDGSVVQVHADHLGSVRALTDATGAVVGTFAYDAYGSPTGSTGTVSLPFGFAGEYRDAESGLVYLRARYLDPSTGQFVSRDPITAMTKSPYGYTGGTPTAYTDPSGLITAGLCLSGSVNFVVHVSAQLCAVVDDHGDVGVSATKGAGVGALGAGAGGSFQYTTANRVGDLRGQNQFVGGSVNLPWFSAGEEFGAGQDCAGSSYYTGTFTMGGGAKKPSVETHAGISDTAVLSSGPTSCGGKKGNVIIGGIFTGCGEIGVISLPASFLSQSRGWPPANVGSPWPF
jgi:RHS repeat-associated protein